jgi:hypothetical protein
MNVKILDLSRERRGVPTGVPATILRFSVLVYFRYIFSEKSRRSG